jgi:hypothetical protein
MEINLKPILIISIIFLILCMSFYFISLTLNTNKTICYAEARIHTLMAESNNDVFDLYTNFNTVTTIEYVEGELVDGYCKVGDVYVINYKLEE